MEENQEKFAPESSGGDDDDATTTPRGDGDGDGDEHKGATTAAGVKRKRG
uniref:Uncharacterized protein n=1 Tax=Zea mays TaxID=4577 RepID=B6U3K4_MAIZE|nr:hypothetical protein [Zea mays]